jgi:hypothetical protein
MLNTIARPAERLSGLDTQRHGKRPATRADLAGISRTRQFAWSSAYLQRLTPASDTLVGRRSAAVAELGRYAITQATR